jgi:hypothetical protein
VAPTGALNTPPAVPRLSLSNLHPDSLRRITPAVLFELLQPYRDFFRRSGYPTFPDSPPPDEKDAFDYDAIYHFVTSAEFDCPERLDEALYFINGVASDLHAAALLEAATKERIELDLPADASAGDVAVRTWLRAPRLIEMRHAEGQIGRDTTLTFYRPAKRTPAPADYHTLTDDELDSLGRSLAPWFHNRKRGHACRVFQFKRPEGIWFLVRHGDLVHRRATYSLKTHEESTSRYRPQVHDSIVFRPATGELGIRATGIQLLRLYSTVMGRWLFGDDDYFRAQPKYTLEPLRRGPSVLDTGEFREEIAWIALTRLKFAHPGRLSESVTVKCADVFGYFGQAGIDFPTGVLRGATFRVQFAAGEAPREFSITSDTKARQLKDADHIALERFLMTRGFIVAQEAPEDAPTQLTLVRA